MKKTLLNLLLVLLVLPLAFSGCGGDDAPPVAEVSVTPKTVNLPFPELHTVSLTWQPSAPLDGFTGTPTVFVHLLDERDEVVRTFDHQFPGRWREGVPTTYEIDLYQSTLAPALPKGRYRLTLGLAGEGKQRWALGGLGEPIARREYLAAKVEVPAPPANKKSGPRFTFSEQWLPPEPGGDRQVLARRWLTQTGGLRVAGLRQPGSVWLVLRIPESGTAGAVNVEGGGLPSVNLEGSCGGYEASISGAGIHEVEMPVADPPKNGQCRVTLRPNFSFGSPGRSVALENVAWAPSRLRPQTPAAPASPTAPARP